MYKTTYLVENVFSAQSFKGDTIDWGLKAIYAENAWQKTKGKGIKVAVLDTGIDLDHPDLMKNIVEAVDFTDSRYGPDDKNGHGTHVAGIIAAEDNGVGMIGVAPEAQLYSAKVLPDSGNGGIQSIIKGIDWAINKNVDIISMSFGTSKKPPRRLHKHIKHAYDQGIVIVAATGNENGEICYPAAYDEVISVSAVDQNLKRANFSNYGLMNDITAPGVDILSTYKDGGYAKLSGTSMATPMITGAIALIIARYKDLFGYKPTTNEVYEILISMTVDLGEEGKDIYYGNGILDLRLLP